MKEKQQKNKMNEKYKKYILYSLAGFLVVATLYLVIANSINEPLGFIAMGVGIVLAAMVVESNKDKKETPCKVLINE